MDNVDKHRQVPATHTKRWISGTPRLLTYTPAAAKRQLEVVGWLRSDFPRNHDEQGGWLIGYDLLDEWGSPIQAEVTHVLEAETDRRSPGYIEWSGREEIRLQDEFFAIKEAMAATDPKLAEALRVLGWWHTHTHRTPVFMSATDMNSQRLKYFRPNQYAVVLNPYTGIWRAFAGADAHEVPAIMLLDEHIMEAADSPQPVDPARKRMDRNCRKQNRHQKRCRSRKKKRK